MEKETKIKPKRQSTNITLEPDVILKIKEYAEKDERSFSQYINILLKEHIKEKELE